ncbi:hypothetical protein, partial [Candidatus Entotheonella palauensis]
KGGYIMRRWSSILIAFCLTGVMVAPAAAVDVGEFLSITGFIDNHIRYVDNVSSNEEDNPIPGLADEDQDDHNGNLTTDDDDIWSGRTRGRIFFTVRPNAFSKAVVAFEMDQTWGQSNDDDTGGGAVGFDLGNDNTVVELKHLYVEVKIPSTPLRLQVGGFNVSATSLKRCVVYCDDSGGIAIEGAWSPQFKTYSWVVVAEEEFIEDNAPTGGDDFGEDWTIGTSFRLQPAKGIDVHLMGAYYAIDGPSADSSSLIIGRCSGSRDGGNAANAHCFEKDRRYYFGLDARLKFGGLTVSPTFIYLGGKRDLAAGGEVDLQSFLFDIRGKYSWGPVSVEGKFVYIPGNEANDPLDGSDDDLKFWQNISVTTVNRTVQWFELFGFNIDSTHPANFGSNDSRALRSAGTFDQFGLIHPAIRVDYKASKPLTISAMFGLFYAAEDVGAPARFLGDVPANRNWTGEDKFIGSEIDLLLTYQWFKGTTVNLWFAYAQSGDAHDLCAPGTSQAAGNCDVQEAEDRVGVGARMIYRF